MNQPIVEDYESMTPTRLREVYWEWRSLEWSASQMRDAGGMGRILRIVERIERVADRRQISLSKEEAQ